MNHALIVGQRGAGKSTLVRRAAAALQRPVFGFETRREPELSEPELGDPIYIQPFGAPRHSPEACLTGYCKDRKFTTIPGAFDRYAQNLLLPVPAGGVICFDELGFMESREKRFCDAVRSRLDGDIPVIAAVKHNDFPFLNEVRAHRRCQCFYLTEENRNEVFLSVLAFLQRACAQSSTNQEVS